MEATGWAVRAHGLRKSYGGVAAVSGIDLEIAPGEVFALLGPNGAGKTTTVEILEGYRRPGRRRGQRAGHGPGSTPAGPGGPGSASSCSSRPTRRNSPSREMVSHFAGFYPCPRRPRRGDRAGRADRQGPVADPHPVRRPAAAARRRARHHRQARAALPRRADDRLRPGGPARVLGADQRACPAAGPRCCSPPTTWTRRRRWRTGSR